MLSLVQYSLGVFDKNSNLVILARENYDGRLYFDLYENKDCIIKTISLHTSEGAAKRSFTARSKYGVEFSVEAAKYLKDAYGITSSFANNEYEKFKYGDVKNIIRPIELNVSYNY